MCLLQYAYIKILNIQYETGTKLIFLHDIPIIYIHIEQNHAPEFNPDLDEVKFLKKILVNLSSYRR